VTLQVGQWETIILADHSRFEFTPREGLGIAVDLGTTTIVGQILDLRTGAVLGLRSMLNPQAQYGSDVMTRLYAAVYEGKRAELVGALRKAIGTLVTQLVGSAKRPWVSVKQIVLAGNTVMHHLFCDIDVDTLACAPFEPREMRARRFHRQQLGWELEGDPAIVFLPCLGGFVGSDILCGIVATKMHTSDNPVILVDLGTNGEIVLGDRHRILCASTAAGPAFEGGRISMGMRATTGAISAVMAKGSRFRCRVVGDAAPRGICGSGLVDAVAVGLELGLVDSSGRVKSARNELKIARSVVLTQQDVRELQLAKAAIAAGLRVLKHRFGKEPRDPIPVFLAGAFGNYVNRNSAYRIGLIREAVEQVQSAGNSALLGAKIALFEEEQVHSDFQAIRDRVEHVALASDLAFNETFVGETVFPD
jgi:uncharacterized 2Fe-2S/4Fe-4S cluster protein (DUF4445 family)